MLHISLSRSHKSRLRTISGSVLCGGAGRGCPGVKGRREGGGEGGRTSLNTTAATLESDPAGLSCYLASDYTPRPVPQRQPKLCPWQRLTTTTSETQGTGKAAPCQYRSEERYTDAAFAWRPHLVGLDEAHKHGEENWGRSRLGTLSEVVHHIVEGFLESGGRTVPEWKQCM